MFDCLKAVYLYVYRADAGTTDYLIERSVRRYRRECLHKASEAPVIIERTAKGKPFLQEADGIFVSVTHSGEYCIIGVAPQELGIDLQIHDRLHSENGAQATERYLRLSKRFFHPDENEYVLRDPDTHFFEVWCAKESYVKYTGNGIDDIFRSVSILPDVETEHLQTWSACDVYFNTVDFQVGYTLCVCTKGSTSIDLIRCDTDE